MISTTRDRAALFTTVMVFVLACSGQHEDAPATHEEQLRATGVGLPQPKLWRVRPPTMSVAAQARQAQVDQYLLRQYGSRRIVETTQTYSGDIIDWVDPDTVPGSRIQPPPSSTKTPDGTLVEKTSGGGTELERYPELRGPAGSIPFTRPPFTAYVTGMSGAATVEEHVAHFEPSGQPAGTLRLYGGRGQAERNIQMNANIHQFSGSPEAGTFSLLEMATLCYGSDSPNTAEWVGVAVSRGAAGYDGSTLRFTVEFITAGINHIGNQQGGWDGQVLGFVAAAGRPYGPGVQLGFISVNGGAQYVAPAEILLYQGNWWVAHGGNWLGYYPGSLFDLIPSSGCQAHYYGEVYDPTPTTWTSTNMGQGAYASSGFGYASFFQEPFFVTVDGTSKWPDSTGLPFGLETASCYTTSAMFSGTSPWGRYFYLGGPGNEASNACR